MDDSNPTPKVTAGEIEAAALLAAEMGYSPGEVEILRNALAGDATPAEIKAELDRYVSAMFGRDDVASIVDRLRRTSVEETTAGVRMIPANVVELDLCDALGLEVPVAWDDALALVRSGRADLGLAEARADRLYRRAVDLEVQLATLPTVVPLAAELASLVLRSFDLEIAAREKLPDRAGRGIETVTIGVDVVALAQELSDALDPDMPPDPDPKVAAAAVAAMSATTRAMYERVRGRLGLKPASSSTTTEPASSSTTLEAGAEPASSSTLDAMRRLRARRAQ